MRPRGGRRGGVPLRCSPGPLQTGILGAYLTGLSSVLPPGVRPGPPCPGVSARSLPLRFLLHTALTRHHELVAAGASKLRVKGPGSEDFRLCGPYGLCRDCSTLRLQLKQPQTICEYKQTSLAVSDETLFLDTMRFDSHIIFMCHKCVVFIFFFPSII